LACGTGVVAAALIYASLYDRSSPKGDEITKQIEVQVRGGDWLEVGFEGRGAHFRKVTLKGPADFAFEGQIALI
jgi:diaminopimelate epimerase